ncbi:MAG TPA: ATP-binding protein, partial [Methylomirabilota bacterium]|nr:ATP-binding protein [Methylomirabilota bacterium]
VMDITERKRAEYLTGQMFESSPDTIAIVGRDYRYRRVNPVHERVWGLPRETIVGMHLAEVLSMEFFEQRAKPKLDRCFAGEDVAGGGWISAQSGARYMVTTFSPLRPDSERVAAALVIGRDITEYVQAEEALQQAQAELAHVTRVTTLGELAASIAHEVNQPLAAIVADANASLNWLAVPRPDLERVREALEAIATDGHRAAEVIQRIRQLATKSAPRKDLVDVNDVVRDVLPLARAELRHHDVSLVLQLAPELPAVLGDPVQLLQVSLNLVMNAIQAMASVTGRPRILTIQSETHDQDRVRVTTQDTGVGIAAKHRDELFTAFFTTKPGGMGMGLSISRSIVEAHGGQLWTTPNEPHGAIFHFSLPVVPSPLPADVAPDSRPSAS